MRGNTTKIKLMKGVLNRAFNPLFQYDYGQKLMFEDTPLPATYEVHFSNSEFEESKVCIGNSEGVSIPDEYLLSGEPVYVWVFLHAGVEDGETEFRGMIPVITRPESTDIPVTPQEHNIITETIAALNEAIEHAPVIIDGYWYVWSAQENEYINTDVDARGENGPYYTPHVTPDGIISWTNDSGLPNPEPVDIFDGVDFAKKADLPTRVSDLIDDSGHYTKPANGIPFSDMTENVVLTITNKVDLAMVGSTNGIAQLDENGKVPSSQLPSYVDDVVEYPTYADFPIPGESGKLYVDASVSEVYRWSGTMYISVSEAGTDHAPKNNPVFTGSISLGRKNNTVVGGRSSAIGLEVEASGTNAHAEGNNTRATATSSHAEGSNSIATAIYAHAEGQSTKAVNTAAHSEGSSTNAAGSVSHAEGSGSAATGSTAHAEGLSTIAYGTNSHSEGNQTEARGKNSHAEGYKTTTTGDASHAEGHTNTASGTAAHAEGQFTKAYGDYSHAEGYQTEAYGYHSHAEGQQTTTSGLATYAGGYGTIAAGNFSHVMGSYNIEDGYDTIAEWVSGTLYNEGDRVKITANNNINTYRCLIPNDDALFDSSKWESLEGKTNYVEIVGNGLSQDSRSNARVLDWDGNEELAGDLTIFKGKQNETRLSIMAGELEGKMAMPETAGTSGQLLSLDNSLSPVWISPATSVESDNTRPITSGAVYTEIGNINALLATI